MLTTLWSEVRFAGLDLVAFCLRPTSFDLILDQPERIELSRDEMLERFSSSACAPMLQRDLAALQADSPEAWSRLRRRFGSVSQMMKHFKQHVAQRYHTRRGTRGPLWGERFISTYLEPGHASRVVAAWLDHAPVREGLCKRPADWAWSTRGAAGRGDERARLLVQSLFATELEAPSWRQVASAYSAFCKAVPDHVAAVRSHPRAPRPVLTRPELLLADVPHFWNTVAIGSRKFVEGVFAANRDQFGPERRSGARFIAGQNDGELFTLRHKGDLRKLVTVARSS